MGRRWDGRGWLQRLTIVVAAASTYAAIGAGVAHADEIDDYQGSWTDRALSDQYELGAALPLLDAQWAHTHNSYNSIAEMGIALSPLDANQAIAIADQLRIDVRAIELDLHRWVSAAEGGIVPVVCHALEGAVGCTLEKPLRQVLGPIDEWLREPANRDQVLLVYLEDQLLEPRYYQAAEAIIEERIGDLIYRPPGGGCRELDYGLSIDEVRAAGKQVLLVSDCNLAGGWERLPFGWEEKRQGRPVGFEDFPSCGPDHTRAQYRRHLIRYWEDRTRLTATAGDPDDGMPPETAAAMARCGVNLIGFDHLTPFDGRLEALVWSWARGEPRGGRCARIRVRPKRPFGRWVARRCGEKRRPVACLRGDRWRVAPRPKVDGRRAARACRRAGGRLAVPRTGFENQRLRLAMQRRGVRSAWLGYRKRGGSWRALGPAGRS